MEFSLVQQALDELSKSRIFIDDTASPTLLQMRSMARRLQIEHGIDLIIIDYLQLIQPRTSSDNIVQQVTEISRGLKALARELNVPVLAVSQLSRDVEKREVKIPRLSDLRESGSLEQDADVVLLIYRKDRDRLDTPESDKNITEIIIAKHRNGPVGSIKLMFDPEKVGFKISTTGIPSSNDPVRDISMYYNYVLRSKKMGNGILATRMIYGSALASTIAINSLNGPKIGVLLKSYTMKPAKICKMQGRGNII